MNEMHLPSVILPCGKFPNHESQILAIGRRSEGRVTFPFKLSIIFTHHEKQTNLFRNLKFHDWLVTADHQTKLTLNFIKFRRRPTNTQFKKVVLWDTRQRPVSKSVTVFSWQFICCFLKHLCLCVSLQFIIQNKLLLSSAHQFTWKCFSFYMQALTEIFSNCSLDTLILTLKTDIAFFPEHLIFMVQDIITDHFAPRGENCCNSNVLRSTTLKFSGNDQQTL